jgi:hypothetical protein
MPLMLPFQCGSFVCQHSICIFFAVNQMILAETCSWLYLTNGTRVWTDYLILLVHISVYLNMQADEHNPNALSVISCVNYH